MIIKEIDHEKGKIYIHDDCIGEDTGRKKRDHAKSVSDRSGCPEKKQSDKTA